MIHFLWTTALSVLALGPFPVHGRRFVQYEARDVLKPLVATTTTSVPQASKETDNTQRTLLPAVHWDHDKSDLSYLAPATSHSLYYSANGVSDPALQHAFAQLATNLSFPAVILGHSDYVKSVQCQGHDLLVSFTDESAFNYAKTAWASVSAFVLATYTSGCGSISNQLTFWLVDYLNDGGCDTCITATIQRELAIKDALQGVDMVWGTYTPAPNSKRANAPGTASHPRTRRSIALPYAPPKGVKRAVSGASGNLTCGPAPSSYIDGLPTASCNSSTFDQDLDNQLGYFDFSEEYYSASLRAFVPGLDDDNPSDNQGFGVEPSRFRRRIELNRRSFFDGVWETIKSPFEYVADHPLDVAVAVLKTLPGVRETLIIVDVLGGVNKHFDQELPINLTPSDLVESPWGPAKELFNRSVASTNGIVTGNLTLYCVHCSVQGSIHMSGNLRFTSSTLEELNIAANGNIAAFVGLGINAQIQARQNFRNGIIEYNLLPGFAIPHIFAIGPQIALDADINLFIGLQGQVLAGVNLSIPDFAVNLDLVNENRSSSSFNPQVNHVFEAKAQIAAQASLGLPISLAFVVDVFPIDFAKNVSIVERPSISAEMNFTASNTCTYMDNGISLALKFANDVYVSIFDKYQFDLHNIVITLAEYFIPVAGLQCVSSAAAATATDSFGDPNIISSSMYSFQYASIVSYDGPIPLGTAPPTDVYGNPLVSPPNTLGSPAMFSATNTTFVAPPAATDAFAHSFDDNLLALPSLNSTIPPTINASALTNTTDSTYLTIPSLDNEYALYSDTDDGNLYIVYAENATYFVAEDGYVLGDQDQRFFHYYPDEVKQYNVSRIRLANETTTPLTSNLIALVPINYNDNNQTSNAYVSIDTLGNVFYLATCNIQDQPSKVFLVADPEQGVEKLLDPDLRYTVTSGVVEVCYFIPWAQPPSPDAIQPGPVVLPAVSSISAASPTAIVASATFPPTTASGSAGSSLSASLVVSATSAPAAQFSTPSAVPSSRM